MFWQLFSRNFIEHSWRSRREKAAFFLVVCLPALGLTAASARIGASAKLGDIDKVSSMRKAVRLNPVNPELRFRLGTAETYSLEDPDPADGIRQLQYATALCPIKTRYWTALACACESQGKTVCSNHATRLTLALSPMAPRVHWEAANYYLRGSQRTRALRQFQLLLELDPNYAEATFGICQRIMGSSEAIDRKVLAPAASQQLKLAFVDFLSAHGNDRFAYQVWKEVVASHSSFQFSFADPYLEHLIADRKYREAAAVWSDLVRRGIVKEPAGRDPQNLVFNGSFEQTPLYAGFGWRYQHEPYLRVDFADPRAYGGARSLSLNFTVRENLDYQPVQQLVLVEANQSYLLSAYVRSASITSDSGPRLRVIDPDCLSCLNVATDTTVGSTSWHKITAKFYTGPKTQLVRVSVWRPRSRTFPMGITGSFWLDDVSLRLALAPVELIAPRSAR